MTGIQVRVAPEPCALVAGRPWARTAAARSPGHPRTRCRASLGGKKTRCRGTRPKAGSPPSRSRVDLSSTALCGRSHSRSGSPPRHKIRVGPEPFRAGPGNLKAGSPPRRQVRVAPGRRWRRAEVRVAPCPKAAVASPVLRARLPSLPLLPPSLPSPPSLPPSPSSPFSLIFSSPGEIFPALGSDRSSSGS